MLETPYELRETSSKLRNIQIILHKSLIKLKDHNL